MTEATQGVFPGAGDGLRTSAAMSLDNARIVWIIVGYHRPNPCDEKIVRLKVFGRWFERDRSRETEPARSWDRSRNEGERMCITSVNHRVHENECDGIGRREEIESVAVEPLLRSHRSCRHLAGPRIGGLAENACRLEAAEIAPR